MAEYKFPTEVVDLPSKGYFYIDGHPLSSGKVEVKYMTAKEEDILTSQNLIKQGTVIDILLQALIVDKTINVHDLLVGDKNAIMVAARVLGYGKEYEFEYDGEEKSVDLSKLEQDNISGPAIVDDLGISGNGWASYDMSTHIISPIAGRILVFRTHDNKYAKMEIVYYYDSSNPDPSNGDYGGYYTFNYVYQPNDNNTSF